MRKLSMRIEIGNMVFPTAASVEIRQSLSNLTDTATVQLPNRARIGGYWEDVASRIRTGDTINIALGYDGVLQSRFVGFVSKIYAQTPLQIDCEDYAYLLKSIAVNVSYKSVSLRALLSDVLPNTIKLVAADVELGRFRAHGVTAAQLLDALRKDYGLVATFGNTPTDARTLYAGALYSLRQPARVMVNLDKCVEENLAFVSASSIKIKVKAISVLSDNTRLEAEVGDSAGEQRTLFFYGIDSVAALQKAARTELDRLKFDGLSGTFVALGDPAINAADIVVLNDTRGQRSGEYYVKSMIANFGDTGYRQTVELDKKANI